MLRHFIQTFTAQVLPTVLHTPYNVLLLVLQTQNELEHDGKIDPTLSVYQLGYQFITRRGVLALWSGIAYNYYVNVCVQFSNIFITWFFALQELDQNSPIYKRYPYLVGAILTKTTTSWLLGFWVYFLWMLVSTDFSIKSELDKSSKKDKKHAKPLPKYKKVFPTFRSLLVEVKNNKNMLLFLFLVNVVQAVTYLSMEFACDWFYLMLIPKTFHPALQSFLLRSAINATCTIVTWPFHTIIKSVVVGQRYRNTTGKKTLGVADIWKKFQKAVHGRYYRGYLFALCIQVISMTLSFLLNMLKISKQMQQQGNMMMPQLVTPEVVVE